MCIKQRLQEEPLDLEGVVNLRGKFQFGRPRKWEIEETIEISEKLIRIIGFPNFVHRPIF
jgi:hypothetical protein